MTTDSSYYAVARRNAKRIVCCAVQYHYRNADLRSFSSRKSKCMYILSQPAKLQKKQCGGVYFCVYGTAFLMPI